MSTELIDIERVLYAINFARTPAKVRDAILDRLSLNSRIDEVDGQTSARVRDQATELLSRDIGVLAADSPDFPSQLERRGKAIVPALFYRGDLGILDTPLIAVSGARKVSERGAAAAARLGEIVAQTGRSLVSGNARGVDTLTSAASLKAGGKSILVLPEGIARLPADNRADPLATSSDLLVLSQFAPEQPWTVHTAMGRNRVICGLANTVVVVEAGESGGSLAAGREALKLDRRLIVFTYGDHTPAGNQILIDEGARPVSSPDALRQILRGQAADHSEQPRLL